MRCVCVHACVRPCACVCVRARACTSISVCAPHPYGHHVITVHWSGPCLHCAQVRSVNTRFVSLFSDEAKQLGAVKWVAPKHCCMAAQRRDTHASER